ncbi:hypothetical protein ABZ923_04280, partial [Streptomyces sp. NPDC046881]|uniref:hypothetical protein n=1 Tax=Streptomyces sp. NPDC046881 TaxID=3155374 RepID=UPI003404C6A9
MSSSSSSVPPCRAAASGRPAPAGPGPRAAGPARPPAPPVAPAAPTDTAAAWAAAWKDLGYTS